MLKPITLSLLLATSASAAFAQSKVYFDSSMHICDQSVARSYAIVTAHGNLQEAMVYDMKGEKSLKGTYTSISDGLQRNREGEFTNWKKDGSVFDQGMYHNNLRQGVWKRYGGTNVKATVTYRDDSLHGLYIQYDKLTGSKRLEVNYDNGSYDGVAKRYENGKLAEEIKYTSGKLESRTVYNEQGHVIKSLEYANGKVAAAHAYDDYGQKENYTPTADDNKFSVGNYIERMPRPTYNYNEFLGDNIKYPRVARSKGIEGRVILKFVVEPSGSITNVEVVRSVHPELDKEAVRVVSLFPAWQPGMQDGEPVSVYFTLPIQFRLE